MLTVTLRLIVEVLLLISREAQTWASLVVLTGLEPGTLEMILKHPGFVLRRRTYQKLGAADQTVTTTTRCLRALQAPGYNFWYDRRRTVDPGCLSIISRSLDPNPVSKTSLAHV